MNKLMETFLKNGGIAHNANGEFANQSVVLLGGFVEDFKPALEQLEAQDLKDREVFLLHPLRFNPYGFKHFFYEVGAEEAVVALLAYGLSAFKNPPLKDFTKTLDVGYLSSECNFAEEELEEIIQSYQKNGLLIFVGKDLQIHKEGENIARILAMLSHLERVKIVFLESYCTKLPLNMEAMKPLSALESYDGLVVYLQEDSKRCGILEASKQFCLVSKMQENAEIKVRFEDSKREIRAKLQCNTALKGMVGILWIPREMQYDGFCYKLVEITKVA